MFRQWCILQDDESKSEFSQSEAQPDCKFYMKTGNCKYGSMCKYHHPLDRRSAEVTLNSLGLPLRQQEKACPFYLHYRKCKFGVACKFDHLDHRLMYCALLLDDSDDGQTHVIWNWTIVGLCMHKCF
ncbi:hypothetical protein RND81_08G139100 [Saponaria officinalis]|uniref:C3H1-type domain-containing protein n=1 Tax=Saponaria officinalis TaxID=3572 RepID=A0AAW1J8N0_SAPOF